MRKNAATIVGSRTSPDEPHRRRERVDRDREEDQGDDRGSEQQRPPASTDDGMPEAGEDSVEECGEVTGPPIRGDGGRSPFLRLTHDDGG